MLDTPTTFSFQPRKPSQRRPRAEASATPPPPAPLVLVAATYDDVNLILLLTFDRPVSIAAFDGSAIFLGDPTFNNTGYDGTAGWPVLDDPVTVRVFLNPTGPYFNTEVDLTVSAASGIVAVDDGGAWAGTGGIRFLPYP